MVQCIINIILLYSPHNLLCSAAWPAERVTVCGWLVVCWQRQVQRCRQHSGSSASFSCGLGLLSSRPWRSSWSPSPSQLWSSSRWGTADIATVICSIPAAAVWGKQVAQQHPKIPLLCRVWELGVVTGDSECRRVDNGDAGLWHFRWPSSFLVLAVGDLHLDPTLEIFGWRHMP